MRQMIPFKHWLEYKLICGYSRTGMRMFRDILDYSYEKWKAKNWRAELEHVMFMNRMQSWALDTSWKSMKKTGMSKARWKLLSADSVPDERPDDWKDERLRVLNFMILPDAYLRRLSCETGKWPHVVEKFVADVSGKPFEQVELELSVKGVPDFAPEDIACMLCMGWWSMKAWERYRQRPRGSGQGFYDWGFGERFYGNFVHLLRELPFFDAKLDRRFTDAVRDLCRWYYMPHAVTGMFHVLEVQESAYKSTYGMKPFAKAVHAMQSAWERVTLKYYAKRAPYAASEMEGEVLEKAVALSLQKNGRSSPR